MLAKNLVRQIIKRGGTAEIVERDRRESICTSCGRYVVKHDVICAYEGGEDYTAWFLNPMYEAFEGDGEGCEATGDDHTPVRDWEVTGTLRNYDVHMYLSNGGQPEDGGSSYFTVRAISKRGQYDMGADYNPGGWTFCDRLKDLDWAVR